MARLMVVMAGIFETGFAVLLKQSHGGVIGLNLSGVTPP